VQLLEDDYELVTAEDGAQGVAKAESDHPDLILMDISMPVMDGYEATRSIKNNPDLAHTVIIGLSGHAMSGDIEKALAAGCDDYLTKPIDEDLLFEKLEQYLES
jgi:two-component system cell cycle response regulator DivK